MIWSKVRLKSAPMRSILLTKQMRGTRYLSAWRQTVSGLGLDAGDRVEHGDGAVEDAQRALDFGVKSTWPGVSMMLMR
jgi:hypothetical protein